MSNVVNNSINKQSVNILRLFCCFLLLTISTLSNATPSDNWKIDFLGKNEGIPNKSYFTVDQDKFGFIWAGGTDGLIRYDGKRNLNLKHNIQDDNSVSNNNAGNIFVDSKNNLWIGTFGGGLNVLNLSTNEMIRYPYTKNGSETILADNIQTIFEDHSGDIWLGTTHGLYLFNDSTFTRASKFNKDPNSIGFSRIWSVIQYDSENIWISTDKGLSQFNLKSKQTVDYPLPIDMVNMGYSSEFRKIIYKSGLIWIGSTSGLLSFNPQTQSYKSYIPPEYIAKINDLVSINENKLLLGSLTGLYEFDVNKKLFTTTAEGDLWNLLVQIDIRDMFYDGNQLLWLSTRNNGIIKIDVKGNPFANIQEYDKDKLNWYKNKNVWATGVNDQGSLFIGTSDTLYKKTDDQYETVKLINGNQFQGRVRSLYNSKSNQLWIGSSTGLYLFDSTKGYAELITTPFEATGKTSSEVYAIEESKPGEFWLSLFNNGVIYWNQNTGEAKEVTKNNGTAIDFNIIDIMHDSYGMVWFVSTLNGLFKLNLETDELIHYHREYLYENTHPPTNRINSIFEDSSNRIWVATTKGLQEYDPVTNLFDRQFEGDILYDREFHSIAEDSNQNLWLSNNYGVIRYIPNSREYEKFSFTKKLQNYGIEPNRITIDASNTVYLTGNDGFYSLPANKQIDEFNPNPELKFTNIEIDGSKIPFNQLNANFKELKVTHPVNKIVIDFAILDYLNSDKLSYSYRIKNHIDDWTNVSESQQMLLVNLTPGHYPIEIKGTNTRGKWSNNSLYLDLIVSTPWWKNKWFPALAASALLILLLAGLKLRNIAAVRRNLYLEKEVGQRTSELNKSNKKLSYLAHVDSLTKLPNRLQFKKIIESYISRNVHLSDNPFFLMFIDLDDFKTINDSLGHGQGDKLLIALANKLNTEVSEDLKIARLGGDEFLVFVGNKYIVQNKNSDTLKAYAENLANKFLKLISETIISHGRNLRVTASVGVSIYPDHGIDHESLLRNADIAMYQAKKSGRNLIQIYKDGMSQKAQNRFQITGKMKTDLENDLFIPFFQPKFCLQSKRFKNVEVLTRWKRQDGKEIAPLDFIPIAEETGLITKLELQVYEKACHQISKLITQGKFEGRMAINVSPIHFNQGKLIDNIDAILERTNFPSKHLEIEITEGTLISNFDHAIKTINKFKQRDIHVTIDDFGTGYSSLSYLSKFQINALKIDSSLISSLFENEKNKVITQTIISLSHSLGLTVIAEGVENKNELEFLIENKCNEIQGFYFSKPIPFEEYLKSFHS